MTIKAGPPTVDWVRVPGAVEGPLKRLERLAREELGALPKRPLEAHVKALMVVVDTWPKPLPESEVRRTVEQEWRELQAGASTNPRTSGPNGTVPFDVAPAPIKQVESSWRPVDLSSVLDAELVPLQPALLRRKDGVRLLYPGRTHFLFGRPESGKTWVALVAAAEALNADGAVLYLDFESEAAEIVGRLLALGVTRERVRTSLVYVRPETKPTGPELTALVSLARLRAFGLAVLDGVNSALVGSGAEPNSNRDVTEWWQDQVLPLARACPGPTVLIDHVTKDGGADAGPVGAGQKRALISGASLACVAVEPLGRGRTGSIAVRVDKDRPGALRQHVDDRGEVARLHLTASPEGTRVSAELQGPERWQPTALMEKISVHLLLAGEPRTRSAILRDVGGRKEYLGLALQALIADGYVSDEPGPRNSRQHRSLRPFDGRQTPDRAPADALGLPGMDS